VPLRISIKSLVSFREGFDENFQTPKYAIKMAKMQILITRMGGPSKPPTPEKTVHVRNRISLLSLPPFPIGRGQGR
jgi:hypothetical protein